MIACLSLTSRIINSLQYPCETALLRKMLLRLRRDYTCNDGIALSFATLLDRVISYKILRTIGCNAKKEKNTKDLDVHFDKN